MPNYDEKTGISFGVISQNSINLQSVDSWYDNDSVYDDYVTELEESVKNGDITDEEMEDNLQNYDNDYHHYYVVDDDGIDAEYFSDLNSWYITRSPYYTFTKQCSPCCPGAGDLDSPITLDDIECKTPNFYNVFSPDGHKKAYCLPKEYFDEYAEIPYRVFRVEDDQEVI